MPCRRMRAALGSTIPPGPAPQARSSQYACHMAEDPGDRLRRGVAVLVPLAVPLAKKGVFRATTRRLGSRRGYQAGFALYWAT